MLNNKNILLGVTGGIAAYKTCELIREIKKNNGNVQVVMTEAAGNFVTPLTLTTLSGKPVLKDMFVDEYAASTIHIESARWADVVLICPATANTIAKFANGFADNLLTTLVLATTAPVVFCPAMNKEMYNNKLFQQNVEKLKNFGYLFVSPEQGELACGEVGWGRLADYKKIFFTLRKILTGSDKLKGKKVLITAGRTEEMLDPVRYISNYSSGKMGFALAEAAALAGADVTLISGPTVLEAIDGIIWQKIKTSEEMAQKVIQEFQRHDIVIMAAAVADFKPKYYNEHKIKKLKLMTSIELEETQDILKTIGKKKDDKIIVGFAIETENVLENASKKLREKNLDFIVANNPNEHGAGFEHDTNIVTIIDAAGNKQQLSKMSKFKVAEHIIDRIAELLNN